MDIISSRAVDLRPIARRFERELIKHKASYSELANFPTRTVHEAERVEWGLDEFWQQRPPSKRGAPVKTEKQAMFTRHGSIGIGWELIRLDHFGQNGLRMMRMRRHKDLVGKYLLTLMVITRNESLRSIIVKTFGMVEEVLVQRPDVRRIR